MKYLMMPVLALMFLAPSLALADTKPSVKLIHVADGSYVDYRNKAPVFTIEITNTSQRTIEKATAQFQYLTPPRGSITLVSGPNKIKPGQKGRIIVYLDRFATQKEFQLHLTGVNLVYKKGPSDKYKFNAVGSIVGIKR